MAVLQLTDDLYELQIYRIRFCVDIMALFAADFVQYNIIGAFLLVRRQAKKWCLEIPGTTFWLFGGAHGKDLMRH